METPPSSAGTVRYPRKVIVGLTAGWVLIVTKCVLAPNLMQRWDVPIDPGWIIVPTLLFAALITFLVLSRDWAQVDD